MIICVLYVSKTSIHFNNKYNEDIVSTNMYMYLNVNKTPDHGHAPPHKT